MDSKDVKAQVLKDLLKLMTQNQAGKLKPVAMSARIISASPEEEEDEDEYQREHTGKPSEPIVEPKGTPMGEYAPEGEEEEDDDQPMTMSEKLRKMIAKRGE